MEINDNHYLELTFSVFFQCVIKDNTSYSQYDAVNILLLGNTYHALANTAIDQSMCSNYAIGRKKISKNLIANILKCSKDEILRRINVVNITSVPDAYKKLASFIHENTTYDDFELQQIKNNLNCSPISYFDLFADIFIIAIKRSRTSQQLSQADVDRINLSTQNVQTKSFPLEFQKISNDNSCQISQEQTGSIIVSHNPTLLTSSNSSGSDGTSNTPPNKENSLVSKRDCFTFPRNNHYEVSVSRYKLTSSDSKLLNNYLHKFGVGIYRSLQPNEIEFCIDTCSSIRDSYITELQGDLSAITDAALHYLSADACVQFVCIAEMSNYDFHMWDYLTLLRNVITDLYHYSSNNSPLIFAFNFVEGLDKYEARLRIIHSEKITKETKQRGEYRLDERSLKHFDTELDTTFNIPSFFTDLPERKYYIEPLGPEYDPDMDQTEDALEYLYFLLKDNR